MERGRFGRILDKITRKRPSIEEDLKSSFPSAKIIHFPVPNNANIPKPDIASDQAVGVNEFIDKIRPPQL